MLRDQIRELNERAVQLHAQGAGSTVAQVIQQHNDLVAKLTRELAETKEELRNEHSTMLDFSKKCAEDRMILVGEIEILNDKILSRNASIRQITEKKTPQSSSAPK